MTTLVRRLGTGDAVVIGLGAMVGAGVFAAFAPAAAAAGGWLLVGLALAAIVAFCNATSSAQLAMQYPASGGTYVYGRERLGPWWGFLAGWGFVVGKTASCAAMAITFATYVVPEPRWLQRVVAAAVVLLLTLVNLRGITRTARVARLLLAGSFAALLVVVVAIAASGQADVGRLALGVAPHGVYGVLQSAGLLFFAFAGYARIATLGEEVRDPERTIPRAVTWALALAVLTYFVVGAAVLAALGADALGAAEAPLNDAVSAVGAAWASPVVRAGAAIASLGALLGLLAGIGRTGLAMARERDLPHQLAAVHPVHHVPHRAQLLVAVVVVALVLTTDLRGVIGFSSFGVLVYYAVANASAWTQDKAHRRWPRAINVVGLLGCATLTVTLPLSAVLTGTLVLAVGLAGRAVRLARTPNAP
ncbi:APC family permease [Tenggerimyces flavus]|uniref:APC family permease n=1 Tax=Tenggerimyces flavus TaxID=1708749 RepID=A0ABV7YMP3_9ACTN|nr:APC family permease [Tenggerimyces flavus]MBM7789713.1 APA family basic amino acid/polyamine antiporter [Tenggerimyces flavus]